MRTRSTARRNSERATGSAQRRQARTRQKKSVSSEPKLMSSYPDVQPLLVETDTDVSTEFRRPPRRHAIVSIHGEDVDERMLGERKVA